MDAIHTIKQLKGVNKLIRDLSPTTRLRWLEMWKCSSFRWLTEVVTVTSGLLWASWAENKDETVEMHRSGNLRAVAEHGL